MNRQQRLQALKEQHENRVKHLPGKHLQQRHRGGGATASKSQHSAFKNEIGRQLDNMTFLTPGVKVRNSVKRQKNGSYTVRSNSATEGSVKKMLNNMKSNFPSIKVNKASGGLRKSNVNFSVADGDLANFYTDA